MAFDDILTGSNLLSLRKQIFFSCKSVILAWVGWGGVGWGGVGWGGVGLKIIAKGM